MTYDALVGEMLHSIGGLFATPEDRDAAGYIIEKYLKQLAAVSAQQEREGWLPSTKGWNLDNSKLLVGRAIKNIYPYECGEMLVIETQDDKFIVQTEYNMNYGYHEVCVYGKHNSKLRKLDNDEKIRLGWLSEEEVTKHEAEKGERGRRTNADHIKRLAKEYGEDFVLKAMCSDCVKEQPNND